MTGKIDLLFQAFLTEHFSIDGRPKSHAVIHRGRVEYLRRKVLEALK